MSVDPGEGRRGGAGLAAFAAASLALCYFALFLRYGINLPTEGMLLHGFERMSEGRPYEDFFAGAAPGVYYVHSALQGWFHQSIIPGRFALALVNAAAAGALALLAEPLVGAAGAVVAGLLYVAVMPVYPGDFAAFNVPYSSWYSVFLFLAGLLAARRYLETSHRRLPPLMGALAALNLIFDPVLGVLQLACALLLVLARLPRLAVAGAEGSARMVPSVWWACWFLVLGTLLALFGFSSFVLPAVACAILVARYAGHEEPATSARDAVVASGSALLGFLAVTVPWASACAAGASSDLVLEKVLSALKAHSQLLLYTPHPPVLLAAGVMAAGFVLTLRLASTLERRGLPVARIAIAASLLALAGMAWVVSRRPMVEGFGRAVMLAFESSWAYALAVAVQWLLILSAWVAIGRLTAVRRSTATSLLAVTVGAALLYSQVDFAGGFTGWVTAAPLCLLGVVYLATVIADRWGARASASARNVIALVVLAPVLMFAGSSLATALGAAVQFEGMGPAWRSSVALGAPRAPVWTNIGRAEEYRDLTRVTAFLREATAPGERVATFPALDLVSFLSERDSPYRSGYFAVGWLDHADEARELAALEHSAPRFAVVLHEHVSTFELSPAYYYQLMEYFEREYRPFARFGRFMVLANRRAQALPEPPPAIARSAPDERLAAHVHARLAVSSDAQRYSAVEALIGDRIEGDYPELTSLLGASDARVRNATVRALISAGDPRTATALATAAANGVLGEAEKVLALLLAAAWAGTPTVPTLLGLLDGPSLPAADAAKSGLANAAARSFAETFWPGLRASPRLPHLDGVQRMRVREWFRDARADPRLKQFAVATAADAGAYDELWSHVYNTRCERSDAQPLLHPELEDAPPVKDRDLDTAWPCVACEPERLLQRFTNALANFAGPLPVRLRLLYGLVRDGSDPLLTRASLDFVAYEGQIAPVAALVALRKSEAGDALLANELRTAGSPALKERLLWIAAVAAGPASIEAAAEALADPTPSVRLAAAWTIARRGGLGDESLRAKLEALDQDPDEELREIAKLALDRVSTDVPQRAK